jgi:hypothetical protein
MIQLSFTLKKYSVALLFFMIFTSIYTQNPVRKGQWYIIESYQKGRVLQVQPPYENNGVAVTLAQRSNQNNQLFRFEEIGNGFYIIRSKEQNKVLDIRGGSQENNAILQVWNQANVENQKFKLNLATGDNQYYITAKHSNKSISAAAGFPIGSIIVQKYADGLANAMFKFIPQNSPKPKPVVKSTKPTLLSPASGQVVENKKGNSIQFSWNRVPNATSYQLIVQHTNQKNTLFDYAINGTSYKYVIAKPIDVKLTKGDWRWWIRAKIGNKWGEWSKPNLITFTTPIRADITLYAPQTNALLANGNENKRTSYTWNFDWADVPNAEQYEIYIIHPNDHKKSFIQNTPVSKYQLVQRQPRTNTELNGWKWKVRAFINGSYREWSATRTFNVVSATKRNKPKPPPPVVTDNFKTQSAADFNKALKNNFAFEFTNKVNNRSTALGFNVQKKHFKMGEFFKNWRVKYVRPGMYQLQVEIDGKFWSLASEGNERGDVKLAVDDRNDTYQLWKIEQQSDGYYKIINVGNKNNDRIYADTLFYSTKNEDFFLSVWKPEKSKNGRWYFDTKKPVYIKRTTLESRTFGMNAPNGKRVCLAYVWTSDATGHYTLSFCRNDENTRFKFERTTNGLYMIKVKTSNTVDKKWFYLNENLELLEIEKYKDAPINREYGMYWNIINRGNGEYSFQNIDTKRVWEYKTRNYGTQREYIEFNKLANKREQYFKLY